MFGTRAVFACFDVNMQCGAESSESIDYTRTERYSTVLDSSGEWWCILCSVSQVAVCRRERGARGIEEKLLYHQTTRPRVS